MRKTAIVLAGLALFGAAGAMADSGAQGKAVKLSFTKQELNTHDGVVDVHDRIMQVARNQCPTYSQVRNLRRVQNCVTEVTADLVARIDHPRLTSYHNGSDEIQVAAKGMSEADNS